MITLEALYKNVKITTVAVYLLYLYKHFTRTQRELAFKNMAPIIVLHMISLQALYKNVKRTGV
jgi:hypothetical protein